MQADYGRLQGTRLRDHTVRPCGRKAASAIPQRLCGHLSSKLHAILLNTELNGVERVAANLFEACAFAAMKLVCYAAAFGERLRSNSVIRALDQAVAYVSCAAPRAARANGGAFNVSGCVNTGATLGACVMP